MTTRILLTSMILATLAGCGVGDGTGSRPPWADPPTPVAEAQLGGESGEGASADSDVEVIDSYRVRMQTTKGDIVIAVHPEWAPHGAIRFKELVEAGYYDDNRIFRVVPGFVVQFGMHGDPKINGEWDGKSIRDDRVKESNTRGRVTFATSGRDARTTQIFINLANNASLDNMSQNFAPFGEVVEGMDVVDSFNSKYQEQPTGKQGEIGSQGNAYLDKAFPGLDSVVKAVVIGDKPEPVEDDTAKPEDSATKN